MASVEAPSKAEPDATAPSTANVGSEESAPLSKNAQKRLLKAQRVAALKIERKQKKKEAAAAKKAEAAAKRVDEPTTGKHERDEAAAERAAEERKKRRLERSEQQLAAQRIAIDLQFDDKMTEKEVASLTVQLAHSYSVNKKAKRPLNLYFTSLGQRTLAKLENINGFDKWEVTVHPPILLTELQMQKEARGLSEVFPLDDIVYLSSEATETLHAFDPSKVYVIGGIVDHNRLKVKPSQHLHHSQQGHTFSIANAAGYQTAKLPLTDEQVEGRKVLTVNQMLVEYYQDLDWDRAIATVRSDDIGPCELTLVRHYLQEKTNPEKIKFTTMIQF